MITVKVIKLPHYDNQFSLPQYETSGAAGMDLRVHFEDKGEIKLKPSEKFLLPTGLKIEIPEGFELQIRPRSGISFKTGLMVLNSPGTIDSDYRGELKIIIGNLGQNDEIIKHGDRIAQMVFAPVTRAYLLESESLSETQRGSGGFGSTGKI